MKRNLKIVGVFNPCGINPLEELIFSWPHALSVIYQSESGRYYIKYLDTRAIEKLISNFEKIKLFSKGKELVEKVLTDAELKCFLNGKNSVISIINDCDLRPYSPIKNKYYYMPFDLDQKKSLRACYCDLKEFSNDKVFIEEKYRTDLKTFNNAVLFPNKDLYIGSGAFIYKKGNQHLSIENKSVEELIGIYLYLTEIMHLEEAYEIINKIKELGIDLTEYNKFLINYMYNDSGDILDQQLDHIKNLKNIKEKTKSLKLHYFDK
ncbi:MAG: hypothetical protein WC917_01940 [Bacilli bacterium]